MIASIGRTPEWFATTRAGPTSGTCSRPRIRTPNQCRYRASAAGMRTAEFSSGSNPNSSTACSPASRPAANSARPASRDRQVRPGSLALLLVPALDAGLAQELAVLLLGHALAALLDD